MCQLCPPTKLPTKESNSSSLHLKLPFVVALIALSIQVALSEILCGWTKQYTSPIYFSPSKDWTSYLFRTVHHIPDMTGKVAIVSGSNTGIGYETALELARAGAQVIVAARSDTRGLDAVQRIRQEISAEEDDSDSVQYMNLDLASLASVENFAKNFAKLNLDLHLLVLNAGVMKSPGEHFIGEALTEGFDITENGFEYHIGVNHIGHAYLTKLLTKQLKATAAKNADGSRIVSVSSIAEEGAPESGFQFEDWLPVDGTMPSTYEDGAFYGQSKLANLMYATELSENLNLTGVSVYSCHPGVITTELSRYLDNVFEEKNANKNFLVKALIKGVGVFFNSALFDPRGGALTQLHLATADKEGLVNGGFYHPVGREMTPSHPQAQNATLRNMLWTETEKIIATRNWTGRIRNML